jgi:hypothetical protein
MKRKCYISALILLFSIVTLLPGFFVMGTAVASTVKSPTIPSSSVASAHKEDTLDVDILGGNNHIASTPQAVILSCSPKSAYRGNTLNVDIVGKNTHFAKTSEARFSGTGIHVNSTTVTNATHARANLTIAADATLGARDVNVITGSERPSRLVGGFTVKAYTPQISSLSPSSGRVGVLVTIYGSRFGSSRGSSYVKFGSTKVSYYGTWSSTKLKVKAPSGISRTCSVRVRTSYGLSNAKTFKVIPRITSLSTTSGKRGSKVTINGSAFGDNRYSGSYVKFGSKSVSTYYSWSNTKIVLKVPSAPYGSNYVRVTTSGGTSTGKIFTVKR